MGEFSLRSAGVRQLKGAALLGAVLVSMVAPDTVARPGVAAGRHLWRALHLSPGEAIPRDCVRFGEQRLPGRVGELVHRWRHRHGRWRRRSARRSDRARTDRPDPVGGVLARCGSVSRGVAGHQRPVVGLGSDSGLYRGRRRHGRHGAVPDRVRPGRCILRVGSSHRLLHDEPGVPGRVDAGGHNDTSGTFARSASATRANCSVPRSSSPQTATGRRSRASATTR